MEAPKRVQNELQSNESVTDVIELTDQDRLIFTPTRAFHYSSTGLLSEESVTEFGFDIESIDVSESRRKSSIILDYSPDGHKELSVASSNLDDVLYHILIAVLQENTIITGDEDIKQVYRFSELTIVVTTNRILKHIGDKFWSQEFEVIGYDDITDLTLEKGNVASQLVIQTAESTDRVKAPHEKIQQVHKTAESALLEYHDIETYEEFAQRHQLEAEEKEEETPPLFRDENITPIGTSTEKEHQEDDQVSSPARSPSPSETDVADLVDSLAELIERQKELQSKQQDILQELEEKLNRDR